MLNNEEINQESDDLNEDYSFDDIDIDLIGEMEAQAQAEEVLPNSIDSNKFKEGNVVLSKHSLNGKHSLKEDTIFNGKRKIVDEDDVIEEDNYNKKFELPVTSIYYEQSREPEYYNRMLKLKEGVYRVLKANTNIEFEKPNRRKPSKADLNHYYYLVKTELNKEKFTDIEIFVELSEFFLDNIASIFKLLDDKWRNIILSDLRSYVGKSTDKTEVKKTNLIEGTEVEFIYENANINGIIINADYINNVYVVNTMVNIYKLSIEEILKITNNNVAHKFNLTKLDMTDFI